MLASSKRISKLDSVNSLAAATTKSVEATVTFQPPVSPVASARQALVLPSTVCGVPFRVTLGKRDRRRADSECGRLRHKHCGGNNCHPDGKPAD